MFIDHKFPMPFHFTFVLVRLHSQVERHHRRHNIHSRLRHHHRRSAHKEKSFPSSYSPHAVQSNHVDARALSPLHNALRNANNKGYAAPLRFKSVASSAASGKDRVDDDATETTPDPLDPSASVPVVKMEPMPGMKDPSVYVRAPDKYDKSASVTRAYVAESQLTSIENITKAIDISEDRIKGLKLRVVEKQNFLDSLRKRERMLDADVSQDQNAIRNMLNHIDALDLRLTRLKKEDELTQLSAMYDNYTSKAVNLEGQVGFVNLLLLLLLLLRQQICCQRHVAA